MANKQFLTLLPLSPERAKRSIEPGQGEERWSSQQWLRWFLDNHSTKNLIPLGVWKANKFICADMEGQDEAIDAMRAAYKLDGAEGALGILGAVLVGMLPEGAVLPELPEEWDKRQRYRYEEWRDPESRPQLFGVRVRDR